MTTTKAETRRLVRALEREVGNDYLRACDGPISERLLFLPEYAAARTLLLFMGVGPEPDLSYVIEKALADGKTVALPRVTGPGRMEARRVVNLSELLPGFHGIPEPPESAELIAPESIDLIAVPGMAFTEDRRRLGHGGGYYDRFLAGLGAFTVGVAREKLLLRDIPTEPHDVHVRALITESRIIK